MDHPDLLVCDSLPIEDIGYRIEVSPDSVWAPHGDHARGKQADGYHSHQEPDQELSPISRLVHLARSVVSTAASKTIEPEGNSATVYGPEDGALDETGQAGQETLGRLCLSQAIHPWGSSETNSGSGRLMIPNLPTDKEQSVRFTRHSTRPYATLPSDRSMMTSAP